MRESIGLALALEMVIGAPPSAVNGTGIMTPQLTGEVSKPLRQNISLSVGPDMVISGSHSKRTSN